MNEGERMKSVETQQYQQHRKKNFDWLMNMHGNVEKIYLNFITSAHSNFHMKILTITHTREKFEHPIICR